MAWIDDTDVLVALGDGRGVDTDYLALVTPAADAWAQRKRVEAGYVDDPTVAPDDSVKLGTILYAVALYRERASADSFASFDELGGATAFGSNAQIKRLLGIGKAQTDRLPDVAYVDPRRLSRRGVR